MRKALLVATALLALAGRAEGPQGAPPAGRALAEAGEPCFHGRAELETAEERDAVWWLIEPEIC